MHYQQATSHKPQTTSHKPQATSHKPASQEAYQPSYQQATSHKPTSKYDSAYDSSVTTRAHVFHLGFLKKLLGVKKGTDTNCVVLRETGQMPIFLLVQMHHTILEQFTLFKQPSS
jgi:hypothetical protein